MGGINASCGCPSEEAGPTGKMAADWNRNKVRWDSASSGGGAASVLVSRVLLGGEGGEGWGGGDGQGAGLRG